MTIDELIKEATLHMKEMYQREKESMWEYKYYSLSLEILEKLELGKDGKTLSKDFLDKFLHNMKLHLDFYKKLECFVSNQSQEKNKLDELIEDANFYMKKTRKLWNHRLMENQHYQTSQALLEYLINIKKGIYLPYWTYWGIFIDNALPQADIYDKVESFLAKHPDKITRRDPGKKLKLSELIEENKEYIQIMEQKEKRTVWEQQCYELAQLILEHLENVKKEIPFPRPFYRKLIKRFDEKSDLFKDLAQFLLDHPTQIEPFDFDFEESNEE